ncbi:MAG TPA: FtsX-like permease family protein [Mycobacteriales bacterium]|nr:FtsX-like permease family protein [Mycobacteriales bacterium]
MSRVALTLRIARRDALRARGRSALVVAMIGLPVLGVGAADVLYRTYQLSPDQKASREMGAADAMLSDTGASSIEQLGGPYGGWNGGDQPRPGPAPAITSVLPAGSRTLAWVQGGQVTLTAGDRTVSSQVASVDYTDPLARGIFIRAQGRPPANAGEITVDTAAADHLHVHIGDVVALRPTVAQGPAATTRDVTITGIVTYAEQVGEVLSILPPDAAPPGSTATYLVQAPRPLTWADVQKANASGFTLSPRTTFPGEPPAPVDEGPHVSTSTLTAVSLIVGMTLLEIVLLAGPAFAVGAKRQSRDLALLSATGAERGNVRAVVLASGVVLGGVGGVLGAVLGIVLARIATPRLESYRGVVPGPFEVRPLEMIGVALVGLVTAVLAALLPARNAARQDVVAALTGRRGQLRSLKRVPILGVVTAVAGTFIALQGARERSTDIILAGSALAELGIVATTPFLIGLIGRIGPLLPVGPRLALRDATRNRGRTAPAVSAVLAAVAGSVAVSCYLVSLDHYDRSRYTPSAPYGSTNVSLSGSTDAEAARVADALRATLPAGTAVRVVRGIALQGGADGTDPYPQIQYCQVDCARPAASPRLLANASTIAGQLLVGDVATLSAVLGRDAHAYAGVLAAGGVVAPFGGVRADGTMQITGAPAAGRHTPRVVTLPAALLPADDLQLTFLSPRAAAELGVPVTPAAVIGTATTPPSTDAEDRARNALDRTSPDLGGSLYIERGYHSKYALGLLALVVGSAVIVLGASGIATGLAAADGRADLATLAAVGASPGRRRSLAAFQSAVTAGIGTVLGTIAGLVPAAAMVRALNQQLHHDGSPSWVSYPFVMPWHSLLITVIAVPLLAAGAAALLTRSRLPMVRRVA